MSSYATKKCARRHRVVTYASQRHLTTQRRKRRLQSIRDDALPENTASAMLDDTPSSYRAVEGDFASPSRRAPSHTMLDDVVSQKLPRRDARWHAARKPLLSKVLDSPIRVPARVESPGESHQKPRQAVLDTIPSSSPQ